VGSVFCGDAFSTNARSGSALLGGGGSGGRGETMRRRVVGGDGLP
jgi:hypothetical protein